MPERQFDWVCKYLCRVSMPSGSSSKELGLQKGVLLKADSCRVLVKTDSCVVKKES